MALMEMAMETAMALTETEQGQTVALEVMEAQVLTEVLVPMVEQALTVEQVPMVEQALTVVGGAMEVVVEVMVDQETTVVASSKEKIEKFQSKLTQSLKKD
jgi:hypothetical protein